VEINGDDWRQALVERGKVFHHGSLAHLANEG